jgi:hypothetical protein
MGGRDGFEKAGCRGGREGCRGLRIRDFA